MKDVTIKVLLLESEKDDCVLIQNLLSKAYRSKFELQWVHDFEAAERAMAGTDYAACLLDERLGEQGGLDLVRRTLLVRTNAPIIMLTARDQYRPDEEAMRAGVADYLVKNQLSVELLERTIHYAIERKRIETVLQHATIEQISLAAAIENISVGVVITDPRQPDNPLIFVNPAFTTITGYTAEETLGRNCRFLQHPASDPVTLQAIRDAIRERRLFKSVLLNRRKDGTLYHNSLVISPVFNEQGELTNFVGLSEDVTVQYQVQEALRKSEDRFEDMVSNVPGMMYRALHHADGTMEVAYVSEGCRELLGIAPPELQANAALLQRMVHPDDLEDYKAAADLASRQLQRWHWQGRFVLAAGEEKIVQGQWKPTTDQNGDVIWDGLLMDVTQHVQAEQKAAHLAAIVESSTDAILGKTLDGIVTSWNRAAEIMYGYRAEEMIGQPIMRIVPEGRLHEVTDLLQLIARGERTQNYETVRRRKDGTLSSVSLTLSPIKNSAGVVTGASIISQDITQRKQQEMEIARQMRRIQALRTIDIAIIGSLDLRITLNIILDQATTQLGVDSAAILLNNARTQQLEHAAGRGLRTTGLQRTHLRIGEGFAGRAALERRVVQVHDLRHEPGDPKRASLLAAEGFIFYIASPIIAKGQVVGVLEILHRAPLQPDSDWLDFLATLTGQAAIAIDGAKLFNDLQLSNTELQVAYDTTLEGWSKALDLRDKETEGHSLRVTEATLSLARAFNIPDRDLIHIRRGALLHDIGKMGIPDSILLKPGKLTDEEWVVMKKHPVFAYPFAAFVPHFALCASGGG